MSSALRLLTFLATLVVAPFASASSGGAADERVAIKRTELRSANVSLTVLDLSPRFLDFYQAAKNVGPDERFRIWKARYGFAAVPPTTQGEKLARELVDNAWAKYEAALPTIEAGALAMRPEPMEALRDVAELLEATTPSVQLIVYVGGFDGNAYSMRDDGIPTVAIPIEMAPAERKLTLIHEMTHAVHFETAGLDGGWERSIAETILQEGLAMRAAQKLVPGHDERVYVEYSPGWFETAMQRATKILAGVKPVLEAEDSETVFQYTMGMGSTGIEREAYLAGWLVVGKMLESGMTLAQVARIPEAEIPKAVRKAVEAIEDQAP